LCVNSPFTTKKKKKKKRVPSITDLHAQMTLLQKHYKGLPTDIPCTDRATPLNNTHRSHYTTVSTHSTRAPNEHVCIPQLLAAADDNYAYCYFFLLMLLLLVYLNRDSVHIKFVGHKPKNFAPTLYL
jgi:hypothetical protein